MAVQFDHPNVLGLIGVSILREEVIPLMVMPYMQNGDVKSFVQSKRGDEIEVTTFPKVILRIAIARIKIYHSCS